MKTFRFTQFINGSEVKLEIQDQQTISHTYHQRTDEGFYCEHIEYHRNGDIIILDVEVSSKDCDGLMRTSSSHVLDIANHQTNNKGMPIFEETDKECYDQYAQLMNY